MFSAFVRCYRPTANGLPTDQHRCVLHTSERVRSCFFIGRRLVFSSRRGRAYKVPCYFLPPKILGEGWQNSGPPKSRPLRGHTQNSTVRMLGENRWLSFLPRPLSSSPPLHLSKSPILSTAHPLSFQARGECPGWGPLWCPVLVVGVGWSEL